MKRRRETSTEGIPRLPRRGRGFGDESRKAGGADREPGLSNKEKVRKRVNTMSKQNTTGNKIAASMASARRGRVVRAHLLLSVSLAGLLALGLFSARFITSAKAWSNSHKSGPALKKASPRPRVLPQSSGGGTVLQLNGTYNGPSQAQAALSGDLARPLSLASADLNGDGVPDLIGGYAGPSGGLITVLQGNADAIYPNSAAAQAHKASGVFTDSPFLTGSGLVAPTPANPDFLGTGDFSANGRTDVALAARGDNKLYVMPGDGHGGFDASRSIDLPGGVTAMASGDVNRADGLGDVVVGAAGVDGPSVMVFEHPDGAFAHAPEVFAMPGNVSGIALGRLAGTGYTDIAVASGKYLVLIHGRDRRLSGGVKAVRAVVEQRTFPFQIVSVAGGDFTGDIRTDLALLGDDGAVYLLSPPAAGAKSADNSLAGWNLKKMSYGPWPNATQVFGAHLSTLPVDSVVVTDTLTNQLHVLTDNPDPSRVAPDYKPWAWPAIGSGSVDVQGGAAAVFAARLTLGGLNNLVLLSNGQITPFVIMPPVGTIFTVTNTNSSGAGSLAQAILDANNNAGADTIQFNIPGAGTHQILVPQNIALPGVFDPVTIDGTTQPGYSGTPIIEITGGAGFQGNGLKVAAGHSTVAGLVVNTFSGAGVQFTVNGSNILENCYLGTDVAGTAAKANKIGAQTTTPNTIGGTTAQARNVISGNLTNGLEFDSNGLTPMLVQGNYIGTDATGTAALGNQGSGIFVNATVNTIGGTAAGAGNVISGNGNFGILDFNDTPSNALLIQGNIIGLNAAGNAAIPNAGGGIHVFFTPNVNVGGTVTGSGNTISGNTGRGIWLEGADTISSVVQGNTIGSSGLGNTDAGILVSAGSSKNLIGGTAIMAGNTISFNAFKGVIIFSGNQNTILTNSILRNSVLGIDLANDGVTPNGGSGGPNNSQNYPVLGLVTGGPTTTVSGTLTSLPNTQFTVEFFENNLCDPSGFGQGELILNRALLTTDNTGNVSFNLTFPNASVGGQFITATATDPNGNTSEFSKCSIVCIFSLSSNTQNFPFGGGSNSFNVNATAGCPWTAVLGPNSSFITINSGSSGTGNGTVNYTVAANPVTMPRMGTIIAAGFTFTVTQDAAPCMFSIMPTSMTFGSAGGSSTVAVTTTAGCNWTAALGPNSSFITINSGSSGSGSGTVGYSVAANPVEQTRMGTIIIAGQTFTVTQNPLPPNYIGFVDGANCNAISGWAADRNRPNVSINVSIYDGVTLIAIVPATNSRPDVGAFLGDNGLHGFAITTPAALKNGVSHTVHFKFEASATELTGGSPATISCPAFTPNYIGFVDGADCNMLVGWVADDNRLNIPITVSVYDGTTLLLTVQANGSRPDVGAFLGDNGNHGFIIPTPAALKDGMPHTVHFKFETGATELTGGSPRMLTCP